MPLIHFFQLLTFLHIEFDSKSVTITVFGLMLFLLSFRPNLHRKYLSVYNLLILKKKRIPCQLYPLYQRLEVFKAICHRNINESAKHCSHCYYQCRHLGIKIENTSHVNVHKYSKIGSTLKVFLMVYKLTHYLGEKLRQPLVSFHAGQMGI